METIDRRQALKIIGGAVGALFLPSTVRAQEIDPLTKQFVLAAKKIGVPDVAGLRVSNPFEREGRNFLAYSSLIFTQDDNGSIVPWNTLDQIHNLRLDPKFKDGSLGVLVPEQTLPPTVSNDEEFQNRLYGFEITPPFVDYLKQIRQIFDPGLPTSPIRYIQVNGERVLATLRLQSMALQYWIKEDVVEPQLIGNAATQLEQLIPKSAILTQATDDPEISSQATPVLQGIQDFISMFAQQGGISYGYASSIAFCESKHFPGAQNPSSGARGLWQIMPIHAEKFTRRGWNYWTDWMDPYKNTVVAIEILQTQGLRAWQCA